MYFYVLLFISQELSPCLFLCNQDVSGEQLFIITETFRLHRVELKKYRCREVSIALVGLYTHLVNAVPFKCRVITPFQVNDDTFYKTNC